MTVQEYPPPLITAVAEAEDCFCKPQFLHLFNGGWLCQVLLCGDGAMHVSRLPWMFVECFLYSGMPWRTE